VQPVNGTLASMVQPAEVVSTAVAVVADVDMTCSLGPVAGVLHASLRVTVAVKPNAEQPEKVTVPPPIVTQVVPPVAGVVPVTVVLVHVIEPPPLTAKDPLVEASVTDVLVGTIVVADADPATAPSAESAVAAMRASCASGFMPATLVSR
jgi:hypothetical protein